MTAWALVVLTLSGCGVDETVFIPDYVERYCALQVECFDAALAVFDGVESKQTCLAIEGPRVEAWGAECRYRGAKAKQCLEEMASLTCPSGDTPLDAVIPTVCTEIYLDCELPKNELDTAF
jgi:hypothetical protein